MNRLLLILSVVYEIMWVELPNQKRCWSILYTEMNFNIIAPHKTSITTEYRQKG
jgi:hypothetical protein